MNTLENLIGAKLIDLDDNCLIVEKDGIRYHISLEEDRGDCCGFNEIETTLLIDENNSPIIINTERTTDEDEDDYGYGERCILTLLGESKPIAEINTYSSSGSGWKYGAYVKLVCNELDINVILSSW